ncbi:Flp family type IVb pilin [Streptomyces sp. NBC_01744]|uniref:Flp family type IVb pilin n=1 Tax=Streptomyces sp. NBC_01744 TaxID=2975927 RepID=UPI003D9A1A08|nr:hypothetical protein OIE70_17885 [Streptomyces sp. NBC_01744]
MPQPLMVARWLVYVLFGATVLGGTGLFLTAASLDAVNGTLLGLLAYAAAPGAVGWVLARRSWTGGVRVWWGLIAVQAWLILGGLSNIRDGSVQGFTQLFLPVVILVFLCREESRKWFRLAERERAGRPPFSLPHVIKWRRDRGQTAMEYVGLIAVVAAIILALALSGVGGQITNGLQSAICSLTGSSCPATGDGGGTVEAGGGTEDQPGPTTDGGTVTGGTTGGGTRGDTGDGTSDGTGGGTGGGTGDGTDNGASGGGEDTGSTGEAGDPTDPYEPIATDEEGTAGDEGNEGEKKEECSGFFGCTLDQLGQVGEGLFVDGIWGDVTDLWNTVVHPIDTVSGIVDYGKSLGDKWSTDSKDAGDKWADGDYFDALTDWGGASVNTGVKVLDDMFVGEEVRETWNRGEETQAVTTVIWNVGSLFIPGYDVAKVAGKSSKLGKLGKLAQAIADVADKAKDAAGRARKAAGLGDAKGARKAADEAQEHADDAAEKAEEHGSCTIALGAARLVPYEGAGAGREPSGVPGSGTGILAAGHAESPLIVLAAGKKQCEGEEADNARDAQKEADEADRAADGVELSTAADRAKQTIRDASDKQKTPKSERYSLNEGAIDKLAARAKDNPDLSRGEFGKDELASALDDLTDMLNDKRIDTQSRGSLGGTVLKATDRHQLAEAMAEVRAAKRAADLDAAEGTKVYASVGAQKGRKSVDFGDGKPVDVSTIDDVDVAYKGKDGKVHVVEVKNTANATTQASLPAQAKRLADWAKESGVTPPRAARYQIETPKDWDKIFNGFQKDKKTGTTPPGTPAQTIADNGLGARIAGQDVTPKQLKDMDAAWNSKTDAEKQAARDSGKMKDPKSAMEYLGVS